MSNQKALRSDWVIMLIHWVVAFLFVVSILTGLRIGSDAPDRGWIRSIAGILPGGNVWPYHIYSGFGLFILATAYWIYSRRSGLSRQIALNNARLKGLTRGGRARWWSLHVILAWALFIVLGMQMITGLGIYSGQGFYLQLHYLMALVLVAFPVVHVIVHYGIGGWNQLLRIFRPASYAQDVTKPQIAPKSTSTLMVHPFAVAVSVAAAFGLLAVPYVMNSFGTLRIAKISSSEAPVLNGNPSAAIWAKARPTFISTFQGANFVDGSTKIEVRALHDDKNAYFSFTWDDPTRSEKHLPLVKKEDGWHVLNEQYDIEDEDSFYEDKLSVMFAHSMETGGATAHLGAKPLANMPAAYSGRGLHYTEDGSIADVWHWKASRGGLLGVMDDNFFGPPAEPKPEEAEGKTRYKAGYQTDPGKAFYKNNFAHEGKGGYKGPMKPTRLPKDVAATTAALGKFDLDPNTPVEEGSRWWMTEDESVAYSPEADAAIPVGTVIPGIFITGKYEGDRADVKAGAKWEDGRWTLQVSRALDTGSKFDLPIASGTAMFVSAFDHSQTRHTRHMRPVILDVE